MTTDNKANITTEVIDLLDKLLRYDHHSRLTAAEALAHSYFSAYTRPLLPQPPYMKKFPPPSPRHVF